MTPPLAHPSQRVFAHPEVAPENAVEFRWLFDRTLQLRDTEAARSHKTIHCNKGCRGTVHELKTASDDGAQRIYFTLLHGAAVVLAFHAKKVQDKYIALACTRCHEVHTNYERFLINDWLLHP